MYDCLLICRRKLFGRSHTADQIIFRVQKYSETTANKESDEDCEEDTKKEEKDDERQAKEENMGGAKKDEIPIQAKEQNSEHKDNEEVKVIFVYEVTITAVY